MEDLAKKALDGPDLAAHPPPGCAVNSASVGVVCVAKTDGRKLEAFWQMKGLLLGVYTPPTLDSSLSSSTPSPTSLALGDGSPCSEPRKCKFDLSHFNHTGVLQPQDPLTSMIAWQESVRRQIVFDSFPEGGGMLGCQRGTPGEWYTCRFTEGKDPTKVWRDRVGLSEVEEDVCVEDTPVEGEFGKTPITVCVREINYSDAPLRLSPGPSPLSPAAVVSQSQLHSPHMANPHMWPHSLEHICRSHPCTHPCHDRCGPDADLPPLCGCYWLTLLLWRHPPYLNYVSWRWDMRYHSLSYVWSPFSPLDASFDASNVAGCAASCAGLVLRFLDFLVEAIDTPLLSPVSPSPHVGFLRIFHIRQMLQADYEEAAVTSVIALHFQNSYWCAEYGRQAVQRAADAKEDKVLLRKFQRLKKNRQRRGLPYDDPHDMVAAHASARLTKRYAHCEPAPPGTGPGSDFGSGSDSEDGRSAESTTLEHARSLSFSFDTAVEREIYMESCAAFREQVAHDEGAWFG